MAKKTILRIHCVKHPDYLAYREPTAECHACKMLYVTKKNATRYGIKISKISISTSA